MTPGPTSYGFARPTVVDSAPGAIADLVQTCAASRMAVVDYGLAHRGLGHAPPADHVHLAQRGGVLEHEARDFMVRAAAGVKMADLQGALRPTGQFVPLEADGTLTLGEVVQHNVYGPLRATYGAARNLLLGLRYVDGAGQDIHVGGRTVKNVAGYDVTRFLCGALGEFGLVYEVVARTFARPESALQVEIDLPDLRPVDAGLSVWLASDAAATYVAAARQDAGWRLRLGYFGGARVASAGLQALERQLEASRAARIVGTRQCSFEEDEMQRLEAGRWRSEAAAVVKVAVPPGAGGAVAQRMLDWSKPHAPGLRIDLWPVHGVLWIGGGLDAAATLALDQALAAVAEPAGGWRAWHRRPAGATGWPPFAPMSSDRVILLRLKRAMDPAGIFNPGRTLPTSGEEAAR